MVVMSSVNSQICLWMVLFTVYLAVLCQSPAVQIKQVWATKSNDCSRIPRDSSVIRQPGDGMYKISYQLLPPDSTLLFKGNTSSGVNWSDFGIHPQLHTDGKSSHDAHSLEYLPGRVYEVTIESKWNPFEIEAAYITAVPLGTPESLEYESGVGEFQPSFCRRRSTGGIELRYNFPKSISFLWTAPTDRIGTNDSNWLSRPPARQCLEFRVTLVPWHWHRGYFRNIGGLKHVVCAAKELRRIEDWPNYMKPVNTMTQLPVKLSSDARKSSHTKQLEDGKPTKSTRSAEMHDSASDFYGSVADDLGDVGGGCPVQEMPKPVRPCCACNTAVYRLVIQSDWQQQQHWRDWPTAAGATTAAGTDAPDSPHWSEILGASHSPLYDIFHTGGYASPAVDAFCTTSDLSKLENEFRNQAGENIFTVIRARGIISALPPEQRVRSALFAVNSSHHLISFLTRLVPSPDWCTGLSRIDMCLPNCSWPLRIQYRLEPWDAGVMTGNTYTPVETAERLREPQPMCPITPDLRPDTPFTVISDYDGVPSASSIDPLQSHFLGDRVMGTSGRSYGQAAFAESGIHDSLGRFHSAGASPRIRRRFARLGLVQIERIRINEHENCTPEPVQDDQAFYRTTGAAFKASEHTANPATPGGCQLSTWSAWQPCTVVDLDSCTSVQAREYWARQSPKMQRTRHVLSSSSRIDCEDAILKEEKYCKPPVVKAPCGPTPNTGSGGTTSREGPQMVTAENCQSLPWGPWSDCLNVSCYRPGMIYRWRQFPDMQTKLSCENFPLASQVDTCWPPTRVSSFDRRNTGWNCTMEELQTACTEDPPTSVRLCMKPRTTFQRFYYNTSLRQCLTFEYDPECHLLALKANHPISQTRNVFKDLASCQSMCSSHGNSALMLQRRRARRSSDYPVLSAASLCYLMPVDPKVTCHVKPDGRGRTRWYYDAGQRRCLSFQDTGCAAKQNNFATRIQCQRHCVSS